MKTKLNIVVASLALALAATASFAQSTDKPSVVIVHGAFADGSDWAKVIPLLQAKGVNVVAVQNPLTSLDDDVAATKRAIDTQPGKVVLVGHSWGGVVITQVGDDPPGVCCSAGTRRGPGRWRVGQSLSGHVGFLAYFC